MNLPLSLVGFVHVPNQGLEHRMPVSYHWIHPNCPPFKRYYRLCLSYFCFLSHRSNRRPSPFSYLSTYFYIFCLDWIFLLLSSSSFTPCFAPEPIYWDFNFDYSIFKRTFRSSKGLWLISPLFWKKNFIISKIMGSETLPYVHLMFFGRTHTLILSL